MTFDILCVSTVLVLLLIMGQKEEFDFTDFWRLKATVRHRLLAGIKQVPFIGRIVSSSVQAVLS